MVRPLRTLADALKGESSTPALFAVGNDAHVTRGQLNDAVHELAATLQQSGIRKGDVVSIAEANTVSLLLRARAYILPGRDGGLQRFSTRKNRNCIR